MDYDVEMEAPKELIMSQTTTVKVGTQKNCYNASPRGI